MRKLIAILGLTVLPAVALLPSIASSADVVAPPWAYPATDPNLPRGGGAPDDSVHHVPDSDKAYTRRDVGNMFGVGDWFPTEHPPMPDVVQNGRKPDVQPPVVAVICPQAWAIPNPPTSPASTPIISSSK